MAINLRLTSGDRTALEGVVEDLRETVRRKGARLTGPHSDAPERYHLPLYERLDGDRDRRFGEWTHTVYVRRMTVADRDDIARSLLDREYPDSVHVDVELEG